MSTKKWELVGFDARSDDTSLRHRAVRLDLHVVCVDEFAARELLENMRQGRITHGSLLELLVERVYKAVQSGAAVEDAIKAAFVIGEVKQETSYDHTYDTRSQSLGPSRFSLGIPQPGAPLGRGPYRNGNGGFGPPDF